MNPLPHQIGKVILNLNFRSEKEALQIQHAFPSAFENRLKSVLQQVFDEYSPNGETVLIDKLALNLGEVTLENFDESLKNKIRQTLQEIISQHPLKPSNDVATPISGQNRPYEILLFFLENGFFPWWAENLTLKNIEAEISEQNLHPGMEIPARFRKILMNEPVRKRLTIQFTTSFQKYLISALYPEKAALVFKSLDELVNLLKKQNIPAVEAETVWPTFVWDLIVKIENEKTFGELFQHQLFLQIEEKYPVQLSEIKSQTHFKNPLFDQEEIKSEEQKDLNESQAILQTKPEDQPSVKPTEILVSNAGMILFWPFLEKFFHRLQLLHGKEFRSETHHEKAVLLTQFLVTGEHEMHEWQLPLNKLLCGWPLEKPVQKTLYLTEEEVSEAEEFLTSLIKNWEALKNTSVAALRETFVQRTGILRLQPEKWTLKVERKAVDILRDSLPWPVSIIKLPWMKKTLYTEW